jgi:hypothetical protein
MLTEKISAYHPKTTPANYSSSPRSASNAHLSRAIPPSQNGSLRPFTTPLPQNRSSSTPIASCPITCIYWRKECTQQPAPCALSELSNNKPDTSFLSACTNACGSPNGTTISSGAPILLKTFPGTSGKIPYAKASANSPQTIPIEAPSPNAAPNSCNPPPQPPPGPQPGSSAAPSGRHLGVSLGFLWGFSGVSLGFLWGFSSLSNLIPTAPPPPQKQNGAAQRPPRFSTFSRI